MATQKSQPSKLAERLRERIQSARLADGEFFMTEADLAEEYGVSRTVAREAVGRLAAIGLLEGRKRKGLVIRRPDPLRLLELGLPSLLDSQQDVSELAMLRYVVEMGAIELAVRNGTDEQIHGHCEDVLFENIRAIECGDDGISAHETAQYRVDGFVSIGNSTGICDTGASETNYNRVFIRDCLGFDLYFLDTGRHSVSNALVLSSAASAVRVLGNENSERPCSLKLDNVYIRRVTNSSDVRVYKNSVLDARRVTLLGLNFLAISGEVKLHDSIIAGVPATKEIRPAYDYHAASAKSRGPLVPQIILWPDVKWTADRNLYDAPSLRLDKTTYTAKNFAEFQKQTEQDVHSRWGTKATTGSKAGADLKTLEKLGTNHE